MTFDEAIEKIDNITSEINVRQEVINDIYDVVEDLRKEYAPTVEMMKEQVNVVNYTKENVSPSELPKIIHNGNEGEWSFLDEFSGRLFNHKQGCMTNKNIEDIMRIWLHPETIKVVDE